jgi:uncharacterized protein (DUF1778 family)
LKITRDQKRRIEDAAAYLGMSLNEFAISTPIRAAEKAVEGGSVTALSRRDRALFVSIVDDTRTKPNAALERAARRYRKHFATE